MTAQPSELSALYSKMADDPRVNVWQISLYTCLLNLWQLNGFQKQITVSCKLLMEKAHFGSVTTYHKCIRQLIEFGYILYLPTYDSFQGSTIEIVIK